MIGRATIRLALLLALAFTAPAFGSSLQTSDALDQRLDQGRATTSLLPGSNPSPDPASEPSVACAAATLVHNTNGCSRATSLIDEAADGGRSGTKVHPGGEGRFFDEYAEVSRNGTRMPNSTYDGEFYMFGGQRWGFRINGTGEPRIEIGSGAGRTKLRFPQ